eukprot:Skav211376  [mRNA]  locus=scaffold2406:118784:126497:- [translate_table: standard]
MDTLPSLDSLDTLPLKGHLEEAVDVLEASERSLPSALLNVFGADGLSAIFGRSSADGARRLRCGGFNHVFMIELGGKLAKCIRPHGGAGGDCSEALEAERLRKHCEIESLQHQDQQVLFPRAAFLCKGMASAHYICEAQHRVALEFHPVTGDMRHQKQSQSEEKLSPKLKESDG